MRSRLLIASMLVATGAAGSLAGPPGDGGRYALSSKPEGASAVPAGQKLTRGAQRTTRPRADLYVPGVASATESASRVLPRFLHSEIGQVSDRLEVVFYAKTRPVRMTATIATDGQSLSVRWQKHIEKLFSAFDRDGDGSLNRYELEHIIPVSGIRQIFQGGYYTRANGPPPEMSQIDRDGDNRVSPAELVAYYQEVLPALVTPKATPGANGSQDTTTTELFARLDQDNDGKLTQAELRAAERILLGLDADEDECVSVQEVLSNPTRTANALVATPAIAVRPGASTVPVPTDAVGDVAVYATGIPGTVVNRIIRRYDRNNDYELTRDEIEFDPSTFDRLDADRNGKLTASELDVWRNGKSDALIQMTIAETPAKCSAAVERTGSGAWPAPADIRQTEKSRLVLRVAAQSIEFTVAPPPPNVRRQQIKSMVNGIFPGESKVVEEKDLAGPQNQFLRVIFDAADFNGDGKLTRAEFEKYFDLQASSSDLGLVLSYVVRTPNLFQMLDDNVDSKLGVRELRTAWDRLVVLEPTGASSVSKSILQPSVSFRLAPGTLVVDANASSFPGAQATAAPVQARGPLWFRKMDRNGDGDVSRAEFLGPPADFATLDANQDGLIAIEESEAYESKVRPKKATTKKK